MIETLQDAVKYRGSSLADEQYVDLFGKPGRVPAAPQVYAREGRRARGAGTPIVRETRLAGARPSSARRVRSERRPSARPDDAETGSECRGPPEAARYDPRRPPPAVPASHADHGAGAARVFLKSLTLRGFKSFADKTVARVRARRDGRRRARTARASRTSSTRSRGCSAPRGRARCAAARWTTSSSPAPPTGPRSGRAEVSLTIDNTRRPAADRVLRGHDHPHAVPRPATPSTRSTARRAGCSTSRSCSPTPASAASST